MLYLMECHVHHVYGFESHVVHNLQIDNSIKDQTVKILFFMLLKN